MNWSNVKYQLVKLGRSKNYRNYLDLQLKRSKSKYNQAAENKHETTRKETLVNLVSSFRGFNSDQNCLVIGCRNSYELDLLEKKGIKNVIGIDLFSKDPRVKVMDMMDLKFDSGKFDLIYCSHALEHAYDYLKAINEMLRVAKHNAIILIEVPINYAVSGSDLHDFKSYNYITNLMENLSSVEYLNVLYGKDISVGMLDNLLNTDVARLIVEVGKKTDS